MAMDDSNRINGELLIEIDINNCLNVRHCHEATTGYEATVSNPPLLAAIERPDHV